MDRDTMFRSASSLHGPVLSSGSRIRLLTPVLTHAASVGMALVAEFRFVVSAGKAQIVELLFFTLEDLAKVNVLLQAHERGLEAGGSRKKRRVPTPYTW